MGSLSPRSGPNLHGLAVRRLGAVKGHGPDAQHGVSSGTLALNGVSRSLRYPPHASKFPPSALPLRGLHCDLSRIAEIYILIARSGDRIGIDILISSPY